LNWTAACSDAVNQPLQQQLAVLQTISGLLVLSRSALPAV
jgi:hypothetical protein